MAPAAPAQNEEIKETETGKVIDAPNTSQQQVDEEKVIESVSVSVSVNEPKEQQKLEMQMERIASPEISFAPKVITNDGGDAVDNVEEEVPMPINQKMQSVIVHNDDSNAEDHRQQVLDQQNDKKRMEQQLKTIESLKSQIAELQKENEAKQALIDDAVKRENETKAKLEGMEQKMNEYRIKYEETETKLTNFSSEVETKEIEQQTKINELSQENERLSHELKLAHDRVQSLDDKKLQTQEALNNAIESKMKLVVSTSEEIDHYRKLIQQIAQNKLGCQILSDFLKPQNGKNGFY